MKRKQIVVMVYIVLLVSILLGKASRYSALGLLSTPLIAPIITILVGTEYLEAMDVPFEYMGSAKLDNESVGMADWRYAQYAAQDEKQWTFVIESEEEFRSEYEEHGVDGSYVENFDFENNILLISLNRPISSVRISERDRVWKDDVPYVCADFTYKTECENNVMYYHKLPRIELNFMRKSEIISTKLHMYNIPYEEREKPAYGSKQTQHVDKNPVWPRWGWAFDMFNAPE